MPKRGRKFISQFLVPNLNNGNFGDKLSWLNRTYLVFQIQWSHKSASVWTENDCEVFVSWDKMQGHHRPKDKDYFPKSKQRFRAVLNKLIKDKEITQLKSSGKNTKIYCLGSGHNVPEKLKIEITADKNLQLEDFDKNLFSILNIPIQSIFNMEPCLNKLDCITKINALEDYSYLQVDDSKEPVPFEYENSLYSASEKLKEGYSSDTSSTDISKETEDLNLFDSQLNWWNTDVTVYET